MLRASYCLQTAGQLCVEVSARRAGDAGSLKDKYVINETVFDGRRAETCTV
jgi:hypothetical protein